MTVTYQYLVGAWEEFDDTIRNLIYGNWTATNLVTTGLASGFTPKMRSPGGENAQTPAAGLPYKTLAWWSNLNEDAIYFNIMDRDVEPPNPWRQSSGYGAINRMSAVYIDLFGKTRPKCDLMIKEINRIIIEKQPDTSNRILKTDGTNSAIAAFLETMIEFKPGDPLDKTKQAAAVHWRGVLHVLYTITKS